MASASGPVEAVGTIPISGERLLSTTVSQPFHQRLFFKNTTGSSVLLCHRRQK
jgi:hypothetical protein